MMPGLPLFLSVREVPTLFWTSPRPLNMRPRADTFLMLVLGLSLFGFGETLLIAANFGFSPWIVLAQGVGNVTPWGIGEATFWISVGVLLLWIPLKQVPGIGTILNAVIIAVIIAYVTPYLPHPENPYLRAIQVLIGTYIVGLGAAVYLIANLGPGPRDGLMTGLQRLTGFPIAWVRSSIEVTVVLVGWWLGGTVGIGTLMYAFLIGPAVSTNLHLMRTIFAKPA